MRQINWTLLVLALFILIACSTDDNTNTPEENENSLRYVKSTVTIDGETEDLQFNEYSNSGRLFKITEYGSIGFSTSQAFFDGTNRFPNRILITDYQSNQESTVRNDYAIEQVGEKLILTDAQNPIVIEILFTGRYIDNELLIITSTGFQSETIFTRNNDDNLINQASGNELEIIYSNFDTNHFKDPLGGAISETSPNFYALLDLEESKNTPLTSEAFGISQTTEFIYDGNYVVGYIEYNGNIEILIEHQYE